MAMPTGIGQKHPNVAMLYPPCRATILAGDPSRLLPFFEKSRLIQDQHRLRIAYRLDQIGTHIIADSLCIPPCPPQLMLKTIWRRIPIDVRPLPAVFALHGIEQTTDIRPGTATGSAAGKVGHEPSFHCGQPECPCTHRLQRLVGWRRALLLLQFHGSLLHKGGGTMTTYHYNCGTSIQL